MPSLPPTCILLTIITGFLSLRMTPIWLCRASHLQALAAVWGRQLKAKQRQDEGDRFLGEREGGRTYSAPVLPRRHTERQVDGSRLRYCASFVRIQHAVHDTIAALARHADHVAARHFPRNSHLAHPARGTIVVCCVQLPTTYVLIRCYVAANGWATTKATRRSSKNCSYC